MEQLGEIGQRVQMLFELALRHENSITKLTSLPAVSDMAHCVRVWFMIIMALALPYWFTPAVLGVTFTTIGLLKIYGLCRGVIGGRNKPFFQYAIGTCPTWMGRTWRGRVLRYGLPFVFLGVGLWNWGVLGWEVYARTHHH